MEARKDSEVFPGEDSLVRKVHLAYKNPKQGELAYIYNGRGTKRGKGTAILLST